MIEELKTLLIKEADYIVTMDPKNRILRNASLFISGNNILEVDSKKTRADEVINAKRKIVLPGFINCHHHMFQCGLRGKPELQNQTIDKWINIVCKFTQQASEELIYYSALANMAELLLYGCTTTTDMHYIFPKGKKNFFEATIRAARDIGIRFHPYRGSVSISQKDGAFFPDSIAEDSDRIAEETERLIKKYHDDSALSMVRVGIAPCTIFTNTKEDYKNAIYLSKKYNINVQTHLSESEYENKYSLTTFEKRPLQYLQDLGWEGKSVSFVHAINVDNREIRSIAESKTNIVHCPISNARSPIGEQGIAPIWEMLKNKINVAIGTDGSAGNDSSNILEELRWARIMQGARKGSTYLKSPQVLEMGTINGAKLLNWQNEIGSIEVSKAADITIFETQNHIEYAGTTNNQVDALVSCQALRANSVIVNGRVVVNEGKPQTFSEEKIVSQFTKSRKILYA